LGWAAREMRGTSPARARANAVAWLTDKMGYERAEVLATDRFASLDGYEGAVYGVSAMAAFTDPQYNEGTLCWGVVVSAHDGEVMGAVGGEIEWLQC
jgi:hypothetical protein